MSSIISQSINRQSSTVRRTSAARAWSSRASRRAGVASIEFVMAFPVLMFLVAMIYTVYVATITKSQLTMEVRHRAWLARTNPNTLDQSPFGIRTAATVGRARHEMTRRVTVARRWYPGGPRDITWGNVVLVGSWDYRQVEFAPSRFNPIYPHLGLLGQVVRAQGGSSQDQGMVDRLGQLGSVLGIGGP